MGASVNCKWFCKEKKGRDIGCLRCWIPLATSRGRCNQLATLRMESSICAASQSSFLAHLVGDRGLILEEGGCCGILSTCRRSLGGPARNWVALVEFRSSSVGVVVLEVTPPSSSV